MTFLGRLHPVLVHFPIALVLAAAAAELVAMCTRRAAWHVFSVMNLRAGAGMGAITAVAGWALKSAPFIEPTRLLSWHEWLGAAAAALAIGAAALSLRSGARSYRVALFAAAAIIALAGHLGGTLVWGTASTSPDGSMQTWAG